jgi:type VI protein secretion system component Hcp
MRISPKGLANLIGWAALIGTLALCAGALHAIPGISPAFGASQRNGSPCATAPPRGAAKYSGRIQTAPAGTSFEVNSGKDTAVVTYTESTAICQGGQPVSAGSLTPGLSVTVYGEMNKIGKNYRMAGSLILAEENLRAARTNTNTTMNSAVGNNGAARTQAPPESNGGQQATSSGIGSNQKMQGSAGSGISCESMTFNVPGITESSTGQAAGRMQMNGITCVRPIDQQSMQLMAECMTGQHKASITLTWQSVFVATLSNVHISGVLFTSSGSQPVAQVTFQFAKMDLEQPLTGTRTTFEGKF